MVYINMGGCPFGVGEIITCKSFLTCRDSGHRSARSSPQLNDRASQKLLREIKSKSVAPSLGLGAIIFLPEPSSLGNNSARLALDSGYAEFLASHWQ